MAQIINRSSIPALLRPGLDTVFFDYNQYPALWKEIYKTYRSDKAVEYVMEMQGLPLAQIKQDGAPSFVGSMQQGYQTSFVHQYYAIAFQITRAAIKDNQYKEDFPQQALQTRNSLETLKNINGALIFNNAFNIRSMVSDGKPMCATDHPIATGTLANTFSNGVQLNESAIEDAITIIKGWRTLAGIQMNLNSFKLLVPQARAFDASRIINSDLRSGTGNNDINVLRHDRYMPGGVTVNQFLTNPKSWFILTDSDEGFRHYVREEVDHDFLPDLLTGNITSRSMERYSFGCANWRAVFGATGA
jgi:hypothetical protein